jgi:phenylpropionate dioxygenase-like ring-hydroxylating dioxygenase large terminal subunit
MARRGLEHYRAGTQDQADDVYRVPASNYYDPERWRLEMDRVFKRMPLMLGFSSELRAPGSYRAMEVAGTPVLITRGNDGEIRAFVNMCSHRGAIVVEEGVGEARRFSCPYHAWTYDNHGALVGILDAKDFGDVDRSCLGLTPLPCAERAGLIWVYLSQEAAVDIDTFLCGYDEYLEYLGFADAHVLGRQTLEGPNWKVAYDGYLDFYHLPVLHRNSFGPDMSTKALYHAWGPHQRVTAPDRHFEKIADVPEDEWSERVIAGGVWTIFPHVSIAAFDAGGKVYMVSQLFPGATPGESYTVQNFVHTCEPTDEIRELTAKTMDFLFHVVGDEDYYTGRRIQRALQTGTKSEVIFGRNEGGGQRFHQWVEAVLATDDADLPTLFARSAGR